MKKKKMTRASISPMQGTITAATTTTSIPSSKNRKMRSAKSRRVHLYVSIPLGLTMTMWTSNRNHRLLAFYHSMSLILRFISHLAILHLSHRKVLPTWKTMKKTTWIPPFASCELDTPWHGIMDPPPHHHTIAKLRIYVRNRHQLSQLRADDLYHHFPPVTLILLVDQVHLEVFPLRSGSMQTLVFSR
jgi:hypothetical protein